MEKNTFTFAKVIRENSRSFFRTWCITIVIIIEPIAVETLGVFNASAGHLLADLGRRISINTGEARETSYLFQRISVLVQRFNAVLLHDSLPAADSTD